MPKKVQVSQERLDWLRDNHNNYPYSRLAKELSVCTDTLKRILVREGLQDFPGAKYQVSRKSSLRSDMWARPCMGCKNTKPRPKWQYFCKKCKDKQRRGELGDN